MHRNRNEMSRMIELAAMIIIETSAINRSDDVCKKKNVFAYCYRGGNDCYERRGENTWCGEIVVLVLLLLFFPCSFVKINKVCFVKPMSSSL